MKKIILLIVLFNFCGIITAQLTIKLKDSISTLPAGYVQLKDNNNIITASDENGILRINMDSIKSHKLILNSIFYKEKELNLNDLKNNKIILLKPKGVLLDEIILNLPKDKKYIKLTAYSRTYNMIDDTLKSYVDAELFFIKPINHKTFKRKIVNFRIFDNVPKDLYKKNNPFWVPDLGKKTLLEKLNSKYYLVENKTNNNVDIIGKKDKKIYGHIKYKKNTKHNSNIIISISYKTENAVVNEIEEYNSKDIASVSIDDIKYKSKQIITKINSHLKKISPDLKNNHKLEFYTELIISDKKYINKTHYKKLKHIKIGQHFLSHYNDNFWLNYTRILVLPKRIENQLNSVIFERKN